MTGGLNFNGLNPFNVSAPGPIQIGASAQDYLGAQRVGQEAINGVQSLANMITTARQRQEELALKDKALMQEDSHFQQKFAQDADQFAQNLSIKQAELDLTREQNKLSQAKSLLEMEAKQKEISREQLNDSIKMTLLNNPEAINKYETDEKFRYSPEGRKVGMLMHWGDPTKMVDHDKKVNELNQDVRSKRYMSNAIAILQRPENLAVLNGIANGSEPSIKQFHSLLNRMLANGEIDLDTRKRLYEDYVGEGLKVRNAAIQQTRVEKMGHSGTGGDYSFYTLDSNGNPVRIDKMTAAQYKAQGKPVITETPKGDLKGTKPKESKGSSLAALGLSDEDQKQFGLSK